MNLTNTFEDSVVDSQDRNYQQIKSEWSKINSDIRDRRGFGEGVSPSFKLAKQTAEQNAKTILTKKVENNHFTTEVKDVLVKKIKGRYHYIVLLYPNLDQPQFGSDAAAFVTPGDIYF